MKKKLSVIPVLAAALTILFGIVAYGATINKVEIDLPDSCAGMTASSFYNAIEVNAHLNDFPDPLTIGNGLKAMTYGNTYGSYVTNDSRDNFGSDYIMKEGMRYLFYMLVELDSTAASNTFALENDGIIINKNVSGKNMTLYMGEERDYFGVYFYYTYGATPQAASTEKEAVAIIDRDLFKSEAPSKTVIVADSIGANSFFDMKVHAADAQTQANQKLLAQSLVGANTKIFVTENIYPRRDLSISENGSLKVLNWNNLPKNQPGAISAVVYNQIDGSYVIHGILDANGAATFTGFKLRPASTITICK